MQIIEKFKLSDDVTFELLVPPVEEKYNYFYKETPVELNKFDEVTVFLNVNGVKTIIMVDIIQCVIRNLRFYLTKALQNECILPSKIPLGSLMTFYNRDNYRHYWQDENLPYTDTANYSSLWLWSMLSPGMQSWIYNRDHKIYLEIGIDYVVPEPQDDQAFEAFMCN